MSCKVAKHFWSVISKAWLIAEISILFNLSTSRQNLCTFRSSENYRYLQKSFDKMNFLPHLLLGSLAILPVVLSLKAGDCEVCISVLDRWFLFLWYEKHNILQSGTPISYLLCKHDLWFIFQNLTKLYLDSEQLFPKRMKQIQPKLKPHSRSSANHSS